MEHARPTALGLLSAALTVALTGCGSSSTAGPSGQSAGATTSGPSPTSSVAPAAAAGIPCSQAGDLTGSPQMAPPANLAVVPGGKVYMSKGPFGMTSLFFEAVDGDPTNLDAVRDGAVDQLIKAGYTLERKDQEEGSEAEAHLSGPHETAIQVIQLCEGKVRVKYTLTS